MSYSYPFSATLPSGFTQDFIEVFRLDNQSGIDGNITISGGVDDDVCFTGSQGPAYQADQFIYYPNNPAGRRNGAHQFTWYQPIENNGGRSVFVANNGGNGGISGTIESDVPLIPPTFNIEIISDDIQIYNGRSFVPQIVITPYPVDFTVTYNGSTTPPTDVGTYNVYVYIDENPSNNTSKVIKIVPANASINIDISNNYYYNGNQITPYITTNPDGLSYSVTYNGLDQKPNKVGQWKIEVNIDDVNYYGYASKLFFVYEDCSNGIVAYYTLDEVSGIRKDVTGNFPLDETNGTIGSVDGVINKGVSITDQTKYLVSKVLPILKQYSVYFWIKSTGQTNLDPISTLGLNNPNWYFYFDGEFVYVGLGNNQELIKPFVQDGAWHFMCIVFDQYEEGKVSFYLDGVKTKGNSIGPVNSAIAAPIIINDYIEGFGGVFSIDEVGIFQRALSDDEVNDMYLHGNRPVYACNPVPPVPPTPPSPPYVPPVNPPSPEPICPWFYMQPSPYIGGEAKNAYRICAGSREDLYAAVAEFRVNTLLIPAGYVQTDVDSFLWAQNLSTTSIPVSGWNYCEGNVRITGVDLEDLYRAVAAYRQDNGIDVGNWIYDVDTYLSGLGSVVSRYCGCL